MRILLAGDAPSIHLRRWATALAAAGEDVHVASFRSADLGAIPVHPLRTFGLGKAGYVLAAPALARLVQRLRPEVLHAHYATSYGLLGALVGGPPLVITAWGSDTIIAPRESVVLRRSLRFAFARADVVTSMAEHMNESIRALGVAPERLHVLPFGVDVQRFRAPASSARDEHLVVCTRNFAPVYDVATLVRAIARVHATGRSVRVCLVGDGPLRGELERLVAELRLGGVIEFLGHVTHDVLAGLLHAAGVFVSPALSDGNNISLNEAMAAGCIPVATSIPANTQWLAHGETGFLVPPGDDAALARAIEAALDATPEWRDAARAANLACVERDANWPVAVSRMRGIYAELRAGR